MIEYKKQELGAFLINCLLPFQKNQASCKWSNKFLASEASRYCPDNYVPKTLKKSQSLNCEKLVSCLPEPWDMKKNTTCNRTYIATIEKKKVFFFLSTAKKLCSTIVTLFVPWQRISSSQENCELIGSDVLFLEQVLSFPIFTGTIHKPSRKLFCYSSIYVFWSSLHSLEKLEGLN